MQSNSGVTDDNRVKVILPDEGVDPQVSKVLESLNHLPALLSALGDDTSEVEITVTRLPPRGRRTSR